MHLDIHVSRFDWAGEPAGIGPGVAAPASCAETIGVRTLSLAKTVTTLDVVSGGRAELGIGAAW